MLRNDQGPTNDFSDRLHAEKYRLPGETFRDAMNRVAAALKDDDDHFKAFREVLLDMRFMPAGRIQAAMGSPKQVTPYNCFVSGTIGDSFTHDREASIMGRATQAATTMRMGGGIGYDFSTLRPAGDLIRGVQSHTGGPLTFMPIYDAVCKATSSYGNRRGAQMGVLRIDHPDVLAFIAAKHDLSSLGGFNVSVAVTDKFMKAMKAGTGYDLEWGGRVYDTIDAGATWEALMRSTWDYAEPGVLFIDTINRMNNLRYCETIAATNPCGEQPLPPFGACLLGSLNVARYLKRDVLPGTYKIDYEAIERDMPVIVRAMDNVVDRAIYPLVEQEREAKAKRRMGLGVTGMANAVEACGHPYGSPGALRIVKQVLEAVRDGAYMASAELAREKGSFPLYLEEMFLKSEFVATLPKRVRQAIKAFGIRNSHLTSIAPTGTISFCADYASSGIEPVYGFEHEHEDGSVHLEYGGSRDVIMPEGKIEVEVADYGFAKLGVEGKFAQQVTAREHVDTLVTAATLVDSAVSKTCNVDGSMPWDDFKGIYERVWEEGGKGCTTFNSDGKRFGVFKRKIVDRPDADGLTCEIGADGRRSCE